MFLGLYHTKLQSLNHIEIPIAWLNIYKSGIYITQGFENNAMILSEDSFQGIYQSIINLNFADPTVRLFSRLFFGAAKYTKIRDEGYITLSDNLLKIAEIQENIVLIGQGNYIEVWSDKNWALEEEKIIHSLNNPEIFSNLQIGIN